MTCTEKKATNMKVRERENKELLTKKIAYFPLNRLNQCKIPILRWYSWRKHEYVPVVFLECAFREPVAGGI
jgi:hypothetical protein